MDRPFSNGIVISIALIAAAFVLSSVLMYQNTHHLILDASAVERSNELLDCLDDLISTVKDAETGQRGYLITGEASYLEPYHTAVEELRGKIEHLKQMAEDDPRLEVRIPELERNIAAKLEELEQTLALWRTDPEAARRLILSDKGEKLMNALRAQVDEMEREERDLLSQRKNQSHRSYRTAVVTDLLTTLLGLIMVGLLVRALRRHLQDRERQAAEALRAAETIRHLSRFPEENPNPVIRIAADGTVLYTNPASGTLMAHWGAALGQRLPDEGARRIADILQSGRTVEEEIDCGVCTFSCILAPIVEAGYVNLYGRDITKRKKAEEALWEAKEHLEIRVRQRTAELERINQALEMEVVERKRAELSVSAERQRLYGLLETLPVYVVLLTPDYHVSFANRFFRERFGESHGRRCYEYLFGRSEPCEVCETYKVLKTMSPLEWEWTGPDGRDYSIYDFPYTDMDGSMMILEMGIDVTERKRAEDALREANETLERRVVERTADLQEREEDLNWAQAVATIGSWRLDVQRNELLWSDENHRIFGIPKGTPMTYETFLAAVHLEDRQYVDGKWAAALRGEPYDIEHRILVGDKVKWVREKAELEFNEKGVLLGGFGTTQDISDRVESEHQLRLLSTALESAANGMAITDREGKIIWINPAFTQLTGYSREEAIGQNPRILKSGKQPPEAYEELWRTIIEGNPWHGQLVNRRKDGTFYTEEMTITPVRAGGGEITHFVAVKEDVTERIEAEKQLKALNETLEQRVAERTAEAQRRARQLRAMAAELIQTEQREHRRLAKVLHDHLQQILVAARMKVGLLRRRSKEDEALTKLVGEVDELIGESINESRSLTMELSPPVLYDGGLAAGLLWLQRRMEEKHGLKVEVQADPAADPKDENLRVFVFEAARELLFNIVKHAQTQEARVTLAKTEEGKLRLEVQDHGVGCDPEWSLGPTEKGRGFGLFSLRERLDLLGGQMEVETAPGQGMRVVVVVPSGEPVAAGTAAAAIPQPTLAPCVSPREGGLRVLLADDHPVVRKGLADMLREQAGIEAVFEASNGQEAVALALQHHPHVVVLDVTMPRLNGIEAARQIKAQLPEVQIIGLSIHKSGDMAHAMYEAGAVAYLRKDTAPENLVAAILNEPRRP
jgi:PAS domain S-box-containing protein